MAKCGGTNETATGRDLGGGRPVASGRDLRRRGGSRWTRLRPWHGRETVACPTARKRVVHAVVTLAALSMFTFPALAQSNCQRAEAHYHEALQKGDDAHAALSLLRKSTALCPSFHGWFLTGNAQRALNRHAEALAAYERAFGLAESPKLAQMARAYAALARHGLGETCAASRAFQSLVGDGAVVPDWIREPYESFELDLAATGWSPEEMACALETTAAHRTIGVCPKVAVRVEFATDSAAINAANIPKVAALAAALGRAAKAHYRLVGHTDRRGGQAHNQALSERRAASVLAAVLAGHPALKGRIEALGRGERELLSQGGEARDHQLNRRVEVHAVCAGA